MKRSPGVLIVHLLSVSIVQHWLLNQPLQKAMVLKTCGHVSLWLDNIMLTSSPFELFPASPAVFSQWPPSPTTALSTSATSKPLSRSSSRETDGSIVPGLRLFHIPTTNHLAGESTRLAEPPVLALVPSNHPPRWRVYSLGGGWSSSQTPVFTPVFTAPNGRPRLSDWLLCQLLWPLDLHRLLARFLNIPEVEVCPSVWALGRLRR